MQLLPAAVFIEVVPNSIMKSLNIMTTWSSFEVFKKKNIPKCLIACDVIDQAHIIAEFVL